MAKKKTIAFVLKLFMNHSYDIIQLFLTGCLSC